MSLSLPRRSEIYRPLVAITSVMSGRLLSHPCRHRTLLCISHAKLIFWITSNIQWTSVHLDKC